MSRATRRGFRKGAAAVASSFALCVLGCSRESDTAAIERSLDDLTKQVKRLNERIDALAAASSSRAPAAATDAHLVREEPPARNPEEGDVNSRIADLEALLRQVLERVEGIDEVERQHPEPDLAAIDRLWTRYAADPARTESLSVGLRPVDLIRNYGAPAIRHVRKDGETIVWRWDVKKVNGYGVHIPSAVIKKDVVLGMSFVPENWPFE